ncbi:MAG TPA: bifunctional pyr operon transcriptional regulator/uracil phosphoribosyltransferase PyrR [Saprospiraceae bacterium]|nr:bifunctional pyr operon transcriptional regulator/uracil phosphoribosyltransferase PyrR [Saprospiraceae bacterium]
MHWTLNEIQNCVAFNSQLFTKMFYICSEFQMKKKAKIILDQDGLNRTVTRLCHQLVEHHGDFKNSCIIGIQHKGVWLTDRILKRMASLYPHLKIVQGKLDITFFRDDYRTGGKIPQASETDIEFLIENKKVILVDDVLYTGRTIQAALQALQNFGRPASVELLVLIDRRFNRHLPIQANYSGLKVDALDKAYVLVEWKEEGGHDRVLFYDAENPKS